MLCCFKPKVSQKSVNKMLAIHLVTFLCEQGWLAQTELAKLLFALCGSAQLGALPLSPTFLPIWFVFCPRWTWFLGKASLWGWSPWAVCQQLLHKLPTVLCWHGSSWTLTDHLRDKRITLPPGLFSLALSAALHSTEGTCGAAFLWDTCT